MAAAVWQGRQEVGGSDTYQYAPHRFHSTQRRETRSSHSRRGGHPSWCTSAPPGLSRIPGSRSVSCASGDPRLLCTHQQRLSLKETQNQPQNGRSVCKQTNKLAYVQDKPPLCTADTGSQTWAQTPCSRCRLRGSFYGDILVGGVLWGSPNPLGHLVRSVCVWGAIK